jgi:hypothetical protein
MKTILLYQGDKANEIYESLKKLNESRPKESHPPEFLHITRPKSFKPSITSYIYDSRLLRLTIPKEYLKECKLFDNKLIDEYCQFSIFVDFGECLFIFGDK